MKFAICFIIQELNLFTSAVTIWAVQSKALMPWLSSASAPRLEAIGLLIFGPAFLIAMSPELSWSAKN